MIKKRKIIILGSTGSIGKSTIEVIKKNKNKFKIVLLAANKNYKLLLKQAKYFNVKNIIINNSDAYIYVKNKLKNKKINVYQGTNNLEKIIKSKIDYTMCAISGL